MAAGMRPAFLLETALAPTDGYTREVDDVKCWAVWGRTLMVQHVQDRFTVGRHTDTFYARDGAPLLNVTFFTGVGRSKPQPDPKRRLSRERVGAVVRECDRLSAGLDFVRMDLYLTPSARKGIAFGEATFTPRGGKNGFSPSHVDQELGRVWCAGHLTPADPLPPMAHSLFQ